MKKPLLLTKNLFLLFSCNKIWLNLNKGELDDPKNLMRDVSTTVH